MQMQPYATPNTAGTAGFQGETSTGTSMANPGGRIQVPTTGNAAVIPYADSVAAKAPPPPSLVTVFVQEMMKRKGLMLLWLIATAAGAYLIVQKFAKPTYRSEGRLIYTANFRGGAKPLYVPPNIQTVVQMVKSEKVFEEARKKFLPNETRDAFLAKARIEVARMSEFIDVSFDNPDPDLANQVANELMTEGLKNFDTERKSAIAKGIADTKKALEIAKTELESAKAEYRRAHEAKGIPDLDAEIRKSETAIATLEQEQRSAILKKADLELQVKLLEKKRDGPPDPNDKGFDDQELNKLQNMMSQMMLQMTTSDRTEKARAEANRLRREEERLREPTIKGIYPRSEYDRVVSDLQFYESILKQSDENKTLMNNLQKELDNFKKKSSGGGLRSTYQIQLDNAKKDLETIPETVSRLDGEIVKKQKQLKDLYDLRESLNLKQENITLARSRVTDYSTQLNDFGNGGKDPNADDLKIAGVPGHSGQPFSSNAMKIAAGVFGVSLLGWLAFIALFALPQLSTPPPPRPAMEPRTVQVAPQPAEKPRAMVAIVPVQAPAPKMAPPRPLTPAPTAPTATAATATPTLSEPETPTTVPEPKTVVSEPDFRKPFLTDVLAPQIDLRKPMIPVVEPPVSPKVAPNTAPLPRAPIVPESGKMEAGKMEMGKTPVNIARPAPKRPLIVDLNPSIVVEDPIGDDISELKTLPEIILPDLQPAPVPMNQPPTVEPRMVESVGSTRVSKIEETLNRAQALLDSKKIGKEDTKEIVKLAKPEATPVSPVPSVSPVASSEGQHDVVLAIAERISQEGANKGGIVVFAPTSDDLSVGNIVGDLGHHFTKQGDRVLVFDARDLAETPNWLGPYAPKAAENVLGYLDGQAEQPTNCFVPTLIRGVEYSRADISNHVGGVMAARRFRQLVEEMRERYSLVLMVAPTVNADDEDGLLTTLAEGMVLVSESDSSPEVINAMIASISQQIMAPVYGTIQVPKA
jgi:hypothetical protein